MKIIHAAQAAHIAGLNPYDPIKQKKMEIMEGIDLASNAGSMSYTVWYNMNKQMPREIIDWLVNLGYQVYHGTPYLSGGDPNRTEYVYSIYWMYPSDASEPFSPGERFQADYAKNALQTS